jgi:uncharacterized protein (DUF1810 family)
MEDRYDLRRFVAAQAAVYDAVRTELTAGRKRSHWMWFVFPQLKGLGSSPTARAYGIDSLAEARAYLEHELLGARLRECTQLANAVEGRTIEAIFGYPDHLKFRSCMTLFAHAAPDAGQAVPFCAALEKYFAGEEDLRTREMLASG